MNWQDHLQEFGFVEPGVEGTWQHGEVDCPECGKGTLSIEVDLEREGGAFKVPLICDDCGFEFKVAYRVEVTIHIEPEK